MANEVYTRTNQAVFFARQACASWLEAEASRSLDALSQARYHREHTVFHLYRGVLALIHEVADRYRWPLMEVQAVEQLLSRDIAERFPGAELAELIELAENRGSWLAALLSAWRQVFLPPCLDAAAAPNSAIIARSAGSEQARDWGAVEAKDAIAELSTLIDRYRDGMQEW